MNNYKSNNLRHLKSSVGCLFWAVRKLFKWFIKKKAEKLCANISGHKGVKSVVNLMIKTFLHWPSAAIQAGEIQKLSTSLSSQQFFFLKTI